MAISFQQQDAKSLAAMGDSHEYAQSAREEGGRDSLSDAIEVTGPIVHVIAGNSAAGT